MRGGLHHKAEQRHCNKPRHHVQNWERQASAQHMHIRRSAKGERANKMGLFL